MKYLVALAICVPLAFNSAAASAADSNTYRYTNIPAAGFTVGIGSNSFAFATAFSRGLTANVRKTYGTSAVTVTTRRPTYAARCAWVYQKAPIVALVVVYSRSAVLGRSACGRYAPVFARFAGWKRISVAGYTSGGVA